jgi:hypothetical protein
MFPPPTPGILNLLMKPIQFFRINKQGKNMTNRMHSSKNHQILMLPIGPEEIKQKRISNTHKTSHQNKKIIILDPENRSGHQTYIKFYSEIL